MPSFWEEPSLGCKLLIELIYNFIIAMMVFIYTVSFSPSQKIWYGLYINQVVTTLLQYPVTITCRFVGHVNARGTFLHMRSKVMLMF